MDNYRQGKRLELLIDILKILFPNQEINNVFLPSSKEEQRVNFSVHYRDGVFFNYIMQWDNELNFEVFQVGPVKSWFKCQETSKWFKVRDLLRKRFLDMEKLKVN